MKDTISSLDVYIALVDEAVFKYKGEELNEKVQLILKYTKELLTPEEHSKIEEYAQEKGYVKKL